MTGVSDGELREHVWTILEQLQYGTIMADNTEPMMTNNLNTATDAILALYAELCDRVIGVDEKEIGQHGKNEHITIPARNNLRFKQRQRRDIELGRSGEHHDSK